MSLETCRELTPELIDHLERVVWGFETGERYRILERQGMLKTILPYGEFRLLRNERQLIGTIFSLHKKVSIGDGSRIDARYETLLSVLPEEHGKGYAKSLIQATLSDGTKPTIQYAYVEEKNIPSASAFKAQGFDVFGRFIATTFNRLRPVLSSRAALISPALADVVRKQLSKLYRDHALTDFEVSFDPVRYWVLLEQGQPVAGAEVEEELWSITSMPGPDGWFAVHGLPHLPLLNRILNPKRIPVLKLGHLYVPEGREKEFIELVIHLICHYGKKLALAYLDPKSPVYQRLKKCVRFGCFNPLFETPVNIWARFQGIGKKEIAALKERPLVISPLDIS